MRLLEASGAERRSLALAAREVIGAGDHEGSPARWSRLLDMVDAGTRDAEQ
jgi:hypothetical protein